MSEMDHCCFQSGGWCTRPDGHVGAHNQHGNPRDRESAALSALRAERDAAREEAKDLASRRDEALRVIDEWHEHEDSGDEGAGDGGDLADAVRSALVSRAALPPEGA